MAHIINSSQFSHVLIWNMGHQFSVWTNLAIPLVAVQPGSESNITGLSTRLTQPNPMDSPWHIGTANLGEAGQCADEFGKLLAICRSGAVKKTGFNTIQPSKKWKNVQLNPAPLEDQ